MIFHFLFSHVDDGGDVDDNDDDNDGVVDHSLENVGWRRHEVFTLGGH